MNLVVLLGCSSLAVVGSRCLELDTLKGDDVGIRGGVTVDITSSADRGGAGGYLWSLVALRGMLDKLDHFFAVLDVGSNADQESVYLQQFIIPLQQAWNFRLNRRVQTGD